MKFSLDPDWKDLDLDTLLRLADADGVARGRLAGSARLETRAKDVASGLDHLSGTFDVRLTDGAITDLNLAGATLDNLNAVPRLREAVQRRARAQAPGLVAGTSEIASLLLRGRVARRRVELEEIRLASSDYGLEAHGTVSFDGTADLDGTLALSDDASRSLVSESGVLAILAPPGSPVRIPVEIKGTYPRFASSPTSEYVSRVMARAIAPSGSGSAAEMLRRLFGGRSRGEGGAE